ncbi:hypothetical protein MKX54_19790 [Alkalihalobacillus sp. FSL R5-0424]
MLLIRKRTVKKPKITKIKKTVTRRANERYQKTNNSLPKKPFNERMGIWSYTITTVGLGITIGSFLVEFPTFLTSNTDEILIEDISYYKEQNNLAIDERDSLKNENELLKAEIESLQVDLSSKQSENDELTDEITNSNLSDGDINFSEMVSDISHEKKIIALNNSSSFFKDEISVSITNVSSSYTNIQVGANGYDSEIFELNKVGAQVNYESYSKFQIRIIKIDYFNNNVEVQVTKL